MRFALVDGAQQEARKGVSGSCRNCGRQMIPKCGENKIHHWSHKGRLVCDPWWENETEWHRSWKDQFPSEWQEVVQFDDKGEKHIADVKTPNGLVIEFQHSFISPVERRSRNSFYSKIVWVVDGTRRVRDRLQLANSVKDGVFISKDPTICSVFLGFNKLIEEWAECSGPVFFDYGDDDFIWCLLPIERRINGYIIPLLRTEVVSLLKNETHQADHAFDARINALNLLVINHLNRRSDYAMNPTGRLGVYGMNRPRWRKRMNRTHRRF